MAQKNKFNFLSTDDIYAVYKKAKPFPDSSVIITVDDGWQINKENIAAVANQYKIPVSIFITTDAIEKGNFWWSYVERANNTTKNQYSIASLKIKPNKEREKIVSTIKNNVYLEREALTIEELTKIAASGYIIIGSHSVSHPVLINCDDEQVHYELRTSKQKIEEWLNKPVRHFAYPNGDFSSREMKYLQEAGYVSAYTTKPAFMTRESLENIYQLPRFCIFENISKAEAVCRMTGVWQTWFKN